MFKKLKQVSQFVGPDVTVNFFLLMFVGVFYFFVDVGLSYLLQYFLVSLGVMPSESLTLRVFGDIDKNQVLAILVLFGFGRGVCYFLKIYLSNSTQQYFIERQRRDLLEMTLRNQDLPYSLSEILANFTDVVTQSGLVIFYISSVAVTSIATLCLFLYGLYIAPFEMTVAAAALFILVLPAKFLNKRIHNSGRSILQEWTETSRFLVIGLRNNFYLRLSGAIETQISSGQKSLLSYREHYKYFSRIQSAISTLPLIIGIFVVAFVSYISISHIGTSGAVLISFFYLFVRMSQMASETSNALSQFRLNSIYFKKLYHLKNSLHADSFRESSAGKNSLRTGLHSIAFKRVGFSYKDSLNVVENLNFELKKNDVYVIKGESGSGKSTLLGLLLGLRQPTEGTIRFNENFDSLAPDLISYMGPEPYLIPDTIRANLTFANNRECTDEEIFKSLEAVKMAEAIRAFPHQLDQKLSDNIPLSSGQKQRLAIARALLRKPEVFVLDEATANLDHETESFILNELRMRFKDTIAVIVTHRDSFDSIATQSLTLQRKGEKRTINELSQ